MTFPNTHQGPTRLLVLALGLGLGLPLSAEPGEPAALAALELLALDPVDLEDLRGRNNTSNPIHDSFNSQTTVQSNQDLNASISGSSFDAGTINSGGVTIGEHALDNFSGVGVFNIITGNNNAVDAAVGVTINLQ